MMVKKKMFPAVEIFQMILIRYFDRRTSPGSEVSGQPPRRNHEIGGKL